MFLKSVVIRCGQLFQITDVAKDISFSVNTAKAWLGIFEASYQIIILRPYYANINKRLVKTPKVYFIDTGLLCYLTGIREKEHLISGPMGIQIVENFIFIEIYKRILSQGVDPQIYFWRTSLGHEVYFLLEYQNQLNSIEVKSSSTPKPIVADAILSFMKNFEQKVKQGYLIYPGKLKAPLKKGVLAIPFSDF